MSSATDRHVIASLRDASANANFEEPRLRVVTALAWEFWTANRRGWLFLLVVMTTCALLFRIFEKPLNASEGLRFFSYLPMVMSVILAAGFCNFTDRTRRDGIAGFPRHLFSLPVSTLLTVTSAFACGLLSVVGVYITWATIVLQPLETPLLVRWPATLLAVGVVFYQAIIWCLCGFRLTRIISLSLVATTLVGIGCVPMLNPPTNLWATEGRLSAILGGLMVLAYVAAVVTLDVQRRGGARGWSGIQSWIESLTRTIPRRRTPLKSPDTALFWIEWRRSGLVLPAAVSVMMVLILGPVLWFTGREQKETLWAEMWLAIAPVLLAFPVGLGFGKPDFWSLEIMLSPFFATRPVSAGQLLAAKLKAAACSALLAWTILLLIAPIWIYLFCDTKHWRDLWIQSGFLYSPISHSVLPILAVACAVLMTWSLLVCNIWLGYSGRPGFYYSLSGTGLAVFVWAFFFFVWWLDHPRSRGDRLVGMMEWMPWALAAAFTIKIWIAIWLAQKLRRRPFVPTGGIAAYASLWLVASACLVLYAWLLAPRIEYFRNVAVLIGLCAIPAVSVAIAPLTIAWNRHR